VPRPRPLEQRLWERVDKTGACWLWTGYVTRAGYGQIALGGRGGRKASVHRLAYELLVGPIPDGLVIDHMCHVTTCVNPDHLQVATCQMNNQNQRGAHSDARLGVRGVHFDPRRNKYVVRASVAGRRHRGGEFTELADAEAAAIRLRNRVMTNNLADRTLVGATSQGES
jgi:hypothetical protein